MDGLSDERGMEMGDGNGKADGNESGSGSGNGNANANESGSGSGKVYKDRHVYAARARTVAELESVLARAIATVREGRGVGVVDAWVR